MTAELLPIVAKNADEVAKPLRAAVAGTLAEFWHGIAGDRVTAWRIKNAAKVSEKLEKEVSERGLVLNADALPESYAFRWFDKASEEDEPELQEMFAKLLANAAMGNKAALERQNIELISRMTPDAAHLFKAIGWTLIAADEEERDGIFSVGFEHEDIWGIRRDFDLNDSNMPLEILVNVGVMKETLAVGFTDDPFGIQSGFNPTNASMFVTSSPNSTFHKSLRFEITSLGISLLQALYPKLFDKDTA